MEEKKEKKTIIFLRVSSFPLRTQWGEGEGVKRWRGGGGAPGDCSEGAGPHHPRGYGRSAERVYARNRFSLTALFEGRFFIVCGAIAGV